VKVVEQKKQLRQDMRAARQALTPAQRQTAAQALAARADDPLFAAARRGLGYMSVGAELDVGPLLAALAGRGAALALPRVAKRDDGVLHMNFAAWLPGEVLSPGLLGIPQPPPDRLALEAAAGDVILVPALAFTPEGHRLGQGGGCYDRYLANLAPGVRVVGVCFGCQLVKALPLESTDQGVEMVWAI